MASRWKEVQAGLAARPQRWLVTGGAGFVGSHLCEALLRLDQRVRVLDNFATGSRANLEDARKQAGPSAAERLDVIEGDIRDRDACDRAVDGVDFVLHQAALGSVPRSIAHPDETHAVNVDGTVNVFLASRDAQVRTVVYASSSSVYGDHPALPKREADVGQPLSPYAATKRIGEMYADVYHRVYGMRCAGLRYFNVVGPRQSPNGPYAAVVPRWLAALASGERPIIYGDGETSRDFCPVGNVVQANILAALGDDNAMGRVYNVALGQQTTLLELFTILRDGLAERGFPVSNATPVHEDFRAGDIRHSLADVSLMTQHLGYEPAVSVRQGLAFAMDWWVSRSASP